MKWLLLILLPCAVFAQGNIPFGRMRAVGTQSGATCPLCGGSKIYSNLTSSDTGLFITDRLMWTNAANMSSSSGQLLFYTNGWTLVDRNGQVVQGADSLSPTPRSFDDLLYGGNNFAQNSIFIQNDTDSSLYTMIHTTLYDYNIDHGPLTVWLSKFKINSDSTISVIEKNIELINDTVEFLGITACKHANGRDWWVMIKNQFTTKSHLLLFTPDTIISDLIETPGAALFDEGALKVFSPNGNYYATYTSHGGGLRMYQFDRCAGSLSLMSIIPDPDNANSAGFGLSFSPSGRFLYFSNLEKVFRVDMQSNLQPSDVQLVYTYTPFMDSAFGYLNVFHVMELGGDGKIYINGSGGCRYYCTIDYPDEVNLANIGYHHFNFKIPFFNNHTLTNHVNYSLGQLPGSPCDTLGLTVGKLQIKAPQISIGPNPNNGNFSVNFTEQKISGVLDVYDLNGQVLHSEYVAPWSNTKQVNLQHQLSNGMYALRLSFGEQMGVIKFVVKK